MSHPDVDVIADLALGEPVAPEVRAHVESCPECRRELEAMAGTRELLGESPPALLPPPASLRAAVLSAAFAEAPGDERPGAPAAVVRLEPGPSAQGPSVERPAARTARPRRRVGLAWVAAAAAAGIAVGAATVTAFDREPAVVPPVVLASVDLDTLDTGRVVGSADLSKHDGVTDLTVRTGAVEAGDGYLEVWLINRDLSRMVSVGILEPGLADQTFAVPADLVAKGYVIVDVSREHFDDDAGHSGDSLMRGSLPV